MEYDGDLHAWLGRVPIMKPEVQVLLDGLVEKTSTECSNKF
jgi:hypothetical protein